MQRQSANLKSKALRRINDVVTRVANRNNIKLVFFGVSLVVVVFLCLTSATNTAQRRNARQFPFPDGSLNGISGPGFFREFDDVFPFSGSYFVGMGLSPYLVVFGVIASPCFENGLHMGFIATAPASIMFTFTILTVIAETIPYRRIFIEVSEWFAFFTLTAPFSVLVNNKTKILVLIIQAIPVVVNHLNAFWGVQNYATHRDSYFSSALILAVSCDSPISLLSAFGSKPFPLIKVLVAMIGNKGNLSLCENDFLSHKPLTSKAFSWRAGGELVSVSVHSSLALPCVRLATKRFCRRWHPALQDWVYRVLSSWFPLLLSLYRLGNIKRQAVAAWIPKTATKFGNSVYGLNYHCFNIKAVGSITCQARRITVALRQVVTKAGDVFDQINQLFLGFDFAKICKGGAGGVFRQNVDELRRNGEVVNNRHGRTPFSGVIRRVVIEYRQTVVVVSARRWFRAGSVCNHTFGSTLCRLWGLARFLLCHLLFCLQFILCIRGIMQVELKRAQHFSVQRTTITARALCEGIMDAFFAVCEADGNSNYHSDIVSPQCHHVNHRSLAGAL